MKLALLDTVVLTHDLPEHGLRAGDLGAVVELYGQDGVEVEFVRASGQTKALVTLNRGCAGGRRQRHAHGQDRVARLGDARERPVRTADTALSKRRSTGRRIPRRPIRPELLGMTGLPPKRPERLGMTRLPRRERTCPVPWP